MSDNRFFRAEGPFSMGQIAGIVGAELAQPERADELIHDVAELTDATSGQLAVFCDARHAPAFAACHASVVVAFAPAAA